MSGNMRLDFVIKCFDNVSRFASDRAAYCRNGSEGRRSKQGDFVDIEKEAYGVNNVRKKLYAPEDKVDACRASHVRQWVMCCIMNERVQLCVWEKTGQ
jgi:hypothetical protein